MSLLQRTVTSTMCLVLVGTSVYAQSSPEQRAAQIAPLVNELTLVVGHIDLQRVDVEEILAARAEVLGQDARSQMLLPFPSTVQKTVKHLRGVGAGDVYLVVSSNGHPRPDVIVAFARPEKNSEKLRGVLVEAGAEKQSIEEMGDLIITGDTSVIKRAKERQPGMRKELVDAFRTVGDSDLQLVLMPSADVRRAVSEVVQLPPPLENVSPRTLVEEMRWAAVTLDLGAQPKIALTIRAVDAQAALAMNESLAAAFRALAKIEGAGLDIAMVEKVATSSRVQEDRVVLEVGNAQQVSVAELLKAPLLRAQATAQRTRSINNLKQILLAMHNHHDAYRHLPAPAVRDDSGKPLLSWRVLLLPFLEEADLLKEFRLNEPWDSEHNKKLIARMPHVYASRGVDPKGGKTAYMVTRGPHGVFKKDEAITFRDLADGTSNILLVVEALPEHAVEWTKPEDLEVSADNPFAKLLGENQEGFLAGRADGSVGFFERNMSAEILLRMLNSDDGQRLDR